MKTDNAFKGSCLCGGIQYEIAAELAPIQICHCTQCQKAQGAPFASNTPVAARAFTLVSGQTLLREYESAPGKFRVFCSHCGSPIYSRRADRPDTLRIRAGTIDDAPDVGVAFHAFTASQAAWWPPAPDCPRLEDPVPPEALSP